jgi:F-type H+-transporting ATPase subunit b
MKQLTADNERLLAQAKDERDAILLEARKVSQKMYDDAKTKANEEGQRIVSAAKESIAIEKQKAMTDIKNLVAELSLEIAESVIGQEFADKSKYNAYVTKRIDEIVLN